MIDRLYKDKNFYPFERYETKNTEIEEENVVLTNNRFKDGYGNRFTDPRLFHYTIPSREIRQSWSTLPDKGGANQHYDNQYNSRKLSEISDTIELIQEKHHGRLK